MKESVLVIIKPDGMNKCLIGGVFTKFSQADLDIVGIKIINPKRSVVESHYEHLKDRPFFKSVIDYFMAKDYKKKELLGIVYYGENAIKQCRDIAGVTNPEDAHPFSIRGSYGGINSKGVMENVVHVSSDKRDAKREIQLWFTPEEITIDLYPTKEEKIIKVTKQVWK